jgi:pyruvate/2-oxoglutarate dehydrogenase complex dihydrolipoamide dehydrogenase (E3) component
VTAGWRVTQADDDRWGGTCLWRGCIPKKSLYHSALTLRTLRDADRFGIRLCDPSFDWQSVLAWKWHSQESYAGDPEAFAVSKGIEVVTEAARFVSPESIALGDTVHQPEHIVIATGSEAVLPPIPGIELADTSENALRYPAVPSSLAIIGGGFIAMEFAGIFAAFGSQVTVFVRGNRVLPELDEELGHAAVMQLEQLGVRFVTGANVSAIAGTEGDLRLTFDGTDGERTFSAERVLMAVGRRPHVDHLDLEAGAVETDERGRVVLDPFLRSTNPIVWFAGDAAGGIMHTPVANCEGRLVARSIDEAVPQHPDCSAAPVTCFTIPQLASVGMTAADAKAKGISVATSRIEIGSTGAGVIAAEPGGFVKLVTRSDTGTIVGCQIASERASDLIFSAAVAMRAGMTGSELGSVIAVHPSFAEAVAWSG